MILYDAWVWRKRSQSQLLIWFYFTVLFFCLANFSRRKRLDHYMVLTNKISVIVSLRDDGPSKKPFIYFSRYCCASATAIPCTSDSNSKSFCPRNAVAVWYKL